MAGFQAGNRMIESQELLKPLFLKFLCLPPTPAINLNPDRGLKGIELLNSTYSRMSQLTRIPMSIGRTRTLETGFFTPVCALERSPIVHQARFLEPHASRTIPIRNVLSPDRSN